MKAKNKLEALAIQVKAMGDVAALRIALEEALDEWEDLSGKLPKSLIDGRKYLIRLARARRLLTESKG